jgi:AcrR family transcriptional regulator
MSGKTARDGKSGRPRGFDEGAALEAAMRVFWAKSYEGATMADLSKAMDINRSSMYAAFGDKAALYRSALARYREGPMSYIRDALARRTVREVIEGLVNGTVEFLATPGNPAGCLSIQGALACGTGAERIQRATAAWRTGGEAAIAKRLQQARKEGGLGASTKKADLARYVSMVMAGLGVQAANGATKLEMKRIAAMALRYMGY